MRLYVGNLSFSTTEETLQAEFGAHGQVEEVALITDRETGRSKGFGFVEFENEADNQKAVDQLDGKELDGRTINVSLARPKEDRPQRDFGGNGGGGGGSFRQRSW